MTINLRQIQPQFPEPHKGSVLVSEPFLNDIHFRRTVVLLGEHNQDGSVGFILNRLLNITTNEAVPDLLDHNFPLFYGGPVEPNTLHFIHTAGQLIKGAQPIGNGIYWGGDLETVNDLILGGIVQPQELRFFVGYSGWAPDQLNMEIGEKAWWPTSLSTEAIFDDDLDNLWSNVVKTLGQDFAYMANSPDDPQWN